MEAKKDYRLPHRFQCIRNTGQGIPECLGQLLNGCLKGANEITKAWSGMSTGQYKKLKGLKKENLRDNMSDMELILNMLAESTSTEISRRQKPLTFAENMQIARSGGEAAGEARKAVEARTGVPVITSRNAVHPNEVVTGMIEAVASADEAVDKNEQDE